MDLAKKQNLIVDLLRENVVCVNTKGNSNNTPLLLVKCVGTACTTEGVLVAKNVLTDSFVTVHSKDIGHFGVFCTATEDIISKLKESYNYLFKSRDDLLQYEAFFFRYHIDSIELKNIFEYRDKINPSYTITPEMLDTIGVNSADIMLCIYFNFNEFSQLDDLVFTAKAYKVIEEDSRLSKNSSKSKTRALKNIDINTTTPRQIYSTIFGKSIRSDFIMSLGHAIS